MSTTTGLITVAEFERMQDPKDGSKLELHHGEVVKVPPPKLKHVEVQDRIVEALRTVASAEWRVLMELPFQPQPEHEVWVADAGVIDAARCRDAGRANVYPLGAPELVIEVLSPSNTVRETFDRERTCFDGGCREFWIVDPDARQVHVTTPEIPRRTYGLGEQVPVALFGGGAIAVDQIFQDYA